MSHIGKLVSQTIRDAEEEIVNGVVAEAKNLAGAFTMLPNAYISHQKAMIGQDDGCVAADMVKKLGILVSLSNKVAIAAAAIEARCYWNKYVKKMKHGDKSIATSEFLVEMAEMLERNFGVPILDQDSMERVHKRRVQPSIDAHDAVIDQYNSSDRMILMEYINSQNTMLQYDTLETKVVDPVTGDKVSLYEMQRRAILRGDNLNVPADQLVKSSEDVSRSAVDDPTLNPVPLDEPQESDPEEPPAKPSTTPPKPSPSKQSTPSRSKAKQSKPTQHRTAETSSHVSRMAPIGVALLLIWAIL